MALPRQLPATGAGGNPGLDPLELGEPAGDGYASLVLKPVLLLRLPQQPAEQGMVKINHGHQYSVKVPVLLPHVHRQVTLRNRRFLALDRVLTQRHVTRPRSGPTQRFRSRRQPPTPRQQLGYRLRRPRPRRPAQPAVSQSDSGFPEDPFRYPDKALSELETSYLSHPSFLFLFENTKKNLRFFFFFFVRVQWFDLE